MAHVTIYTTTTCIFCKKTKAFLKGKNIDYKEIDVSQDPEKAHEMMEKSGQMGVPVIDMGGQIIVGFNPKAIAELLGSS